MAGNRHRDRLVLDLANKVANKRGLENRIRDLREERRCVMETNRQLASAKLRVEAAWRERADSQMHKDTAETRGAIKLQMKRKVILHNVLASLVFPNTSHCIRYSACSFLLTPPCPVCARQILESGVDWAQDPKLSEFVMEDSSHLLTLI